MNYLFVENSNSMNLLFKEIRKFKPLNKDEEIELFKLAKAGDKFAKDKLIYSNMLYAIRVARRYYSPQQDLDELISESFMGLLDAYESYDPNKGVKFISYAGWHIQDHLSKVQSVIKRPESYRAVRKKINDFQRERERVTGISPSIDEISESLNLKKSFLINTLFKVIDMDEEITNEIDEKNMDYSFNEPSLMDCFEQLSEKEQHIVGWITGMHGTSRSAKSLAVELKLSVEEVNQIYEKSLEKIKNNYL